MRSVFPRAGADGGVGGAVYQQVGGVIAMGNAAFQKLVCAAKRSNVPERLSFGGHYESITKQDAVVEDWLFALDEAKADVAQCCRHLSNPDIERVERKAARRHLAELVAVAEVMAARLKDL